MVDARLSIDYGTSNTVALTTGRDGRSRPLLFDGTPLLPSAVYAEQDGRLLVGRDAVRSARLDPARYEPNPKRRIEDLEVMLGDRAWPVAELVAVALRAVAREAVRVTGEPVDELVMTCPVAWGPARRSVLTEAAGLAGLPAPVLVAEPVAAACFLAHVAGWRIAPGHGVVVYDLGGGTFDAAVVRRTADGFEPLSYQGVDDIGGVDLDALVVAQVGEAVGADDRWQRLVRPTSTTDRRHFQTLWDDARGAKEALSRQPYAALLVPGLDREVHVTREAFERQAAGVLRRTADVTLTAIRQARLPADRIAGIFLVGGGTRTPAVATLLHRATGIAPTVLEQPETVVAEGALHATTPPDLAPTRAAATPATAPTSQALAEHSAAERNHAPARQRTDTLDGMPAPPRQPSVPVPGPGPTPVPGKGPHPAISVPITALGTVLLISGASVWWCLPLGAAMLVLGGYLLWLRRRAASGGRQR